MRYFEFDSFLDLPRVYIRRILSGFSSYRIVSSIMAHEECELSDLGEMNGRFFHSTIIHFSYRYGYEITKHTPQINRTFKALVIFPQYLVLLTVVLVMRQDFAKPSTWSAKHIADVGLNCLPVFLLTVFGDLIGCWYVIPDWQYSTGHITAKVLGTIGVLFVSAAIRQTTAAEHCIGFAATNSTSFS